MWYFLCVGLNYKYLCNCRWCTKNTPAYFTCHPGWICTGWEMLPDVPCVGFMTEGAVRVRAASLLRFSCWWLEVGGLQMWKKQIDLDTGALNGAHLDYPVPGRITITLSSRNIFFPSSYINYLKTSPLLSDRVLTLNSKLCSAGTEDKVSFTGPAACGSIPNSNTSYVYFWFVWFVSLFSVPITLGSHSAQSLQAH